MLVGLGFGDPVDLDEAESDANSFIELSCLMAVADSLGFCVAKYRFEAGYVDRMG